MLKKKPKESCFEISNQAYSYGILRIIYGSSLALYAAGQLALLAETELLTVGAAFLLFFTCLLLRAAAEIFHTKLPYPVSVLLFFVFALTILFVTLGYKIKKKVFALLFFSVMALLLTVGLAIYIAVRRHRKRKKAEESEAYQPMLK